MGNIPKNWCAKNVFCHLKILYLFENISISNMKMNIKSVSNVTKKLGQDLSTTFALNPNPICAKCASRLLIIFASTEYICAPTQVRHRTLAVYEVAGTQNNSITFYYLVSFDINKLGQNLSTIFIEPKSNICEQTVDSFRKYRVNLRTHTGATPNTCKFKLGYKHYGLWRFKFEDTKLVRVFPKTEHIHRKLIYIHILKWNNAEPTKCWLIFSTYLYKIFHYSPAFSSKIVFPDHIFLSFIDKLFTYVHSIL